MSDGTITTRKRHTEEKTPSEILEKQRRMHFYRGAFGCKVLAPNIEEKWDTLKKRRIILNHIKQQSESEQRMMVELEGMLRFELREAMFTWKVTPENISETLRTNIGEVVRWCSHRLPQDEKVPITSDGFDYVLSKKKSPYGD